MINIGHPYKKHGSYILWMRMFMLILAITNLIGCTFTEKQSWDVKFTEKVWTRFWTVPNPYIVFKFFFEIIRSWHVDQLHNAEYPPNILIQCPLHFHHFGCQFLCVHLKTLDTIGYCQRAVFSLGVSQHRCIK